MAFHVWWQRHDGIGGHVWLRGDQMAALRDEMIAQRMVCGREGGAGIPLHKLETPEDWYVSELELEEALDAASAEPRALEDARLWRDWLAFLEGAARNGGLRVKP
ncbi:MAG: hypothetical protein IT201_03235 [Thermoleophilia bacterium]|nr:hypothetical protein [Thermoleophilia bacterium]